MADPRSVRLRVQQQQDAHRFQTRKHAKLALLAWPSPPFMYVKGYIVSGTRGACCETKGSDEKSNDSRQQPQKDKKLPEKRARETNEKNKRTQREK